MNANLISVIIPCYNQAQFLEEALESVWRQTYKYWECIIVNDGSVDSTKEIASQWQLKDQRFKYVYQENQGLSKARNTGISRAKGKYILPLDADDKIAFSYVELALKTFLEKPGMKIVYCKAIKFGLVNEDWRLKAFSLEELSKKNMIFSAAVYKKEDWERVGGYDSLMKYGWEDWEFWIAILKDGGEVEQLGINGFYYRVKKESMLTNIDNKQSKYLLEYVSVKHADFFVRYYGSFVEMKRKNQEIEAKFLRTLKSRKFVIDLFCKTFFRFSIFNTFKKIQ